MLKKSFGNKKVIKGFTLVTLVILSILVSATIPSMLDSKTRTVYTATQAYATEHCAQMMDNVEIANNIKRAISSSELYNLLLNDATGIIIGDDAEAVDENVSADTSTTVSTSSDLDVESLKADIMTELTKNLTSSLTSSLTNSGSELVTKLIDLIYPVGSLYIGYNSTSPWELFGGNWWQIDDRFLYCSTGWAGDTGGEATHTLTIEEIPINTQDLNDTLALCPGSYDLTSSASIQLDNAGPATVTGYSGYVRPHNNMPPYVNVHCWRRTY